jgi:hypothetical protein
LVESIEWGHDLGVYLKENFLLAPEFVDVSFVFTVENVTVSGHKCILSVRSGYLGNLIKKNPEGPIEIKEMTSETFKMFLEFFYTGNAQGCLC